MEKVFLRKLLHIIFILVFISCNSINLLSPQKTKPPKTVFKILEKEIELGDSVALMWYVEQADSILFLDSISRLPSSDTIYISPDTLQTYTLLVYRTGERVKKRKQQVKVVIPEISQFEITDTVTDEKDITITWRARNSKYVSISYLGDSLKYYGKETIKRDTTTMFKIKAFGEFNVDSAEKSTYVKLIENQDLPKKVYHGQSVTAMWKYKRADSIKLTGFDTIFNACDTFTFFPDETKELTLSIYRKYGVVDEVSWPLAVLPPKIAYFSGSKTILRGEAGILAWNVLGGDSVKINNTGDKLTNRGRKFVFPVRDSIFTLYVYDKQFNVTRPFEIKVLLKRAFVKDTLYYALVKPNDRIDIDFFSTEFFEKENRVEHKILIVDTTGNYLTGLLPPRSKEKEVDKTIKKVWETDVKGNISDYTLKEVTPEVPLSYNITFCIENRKFQEELLENLTQGLTLFAFEKHPNDLVGLYTFGEKIEQIAPPQKDMRKFLRAVEFPGSGFETPLVEGLTKVVNSNKPNPVTQDIIILFTSSQDNSSFYHSINYESAASELIQKLRKIKIPVFVVAFGNNVNMEFLEMITNNSGGRLYLINKPEELGKAFSEINRLLRNHYVLSYSTNNLPVYETNINYQNRVSQISTITRNYFALTDFSPIFINNTDTNAYWYNVFNAKPEIYFSQIFYYFQQGEFEIKSDHLSKAAAYTLLYNQDTTYRFIIAGHSDLTGSANQCYELGLKRAESVKHVLIDGGIPANKIKVISFGKENPVWSEETLSWQAAENRRVEIIAFRHYIAP